MGTIMRTSWKLWTAGILVASLSSAQAEVTLRAVMHSDVKIVDPIWTSAYITRNHGYMIYDTLFAMDANGDIRPQMIDRYETSADKLSYTFTLRDGLLWHDGTPVTSEDCIASIKRWAAKDSLGQKVMSFVEAITAQDQKSFTIRLKEQTGLLIFALGKPSSNVPFMMPKRVADTDPNVQISDLTGSGPFVFKKDEWKPGDRVVYVKFDKYQPRAEPSSGLAGGKVVKVDRVEWLAMSDHQQAVNALLAGEIDYMEDPPHDLLPLLKEDSHVTLINYDPLGNQFAFRPNHLQKPFNSPKIRQALWYAFNQMDFLQAAVGDPEYFKVCKSLFPCGTPLASNRGMEGLLESNFRRARELLQEGGYDGTPVVLLHSTDIGVLTNLAPVAKALMERAGFKVDMQSMDWQTLQARRARKDPPNARGWSAFLSSWSCADVLNPVMSGYLNAGCDKAMFGWPCDGEIEKLRDAYARATDPSKQKQIAEEVQVRDTQVTTHVFLGQWQQPAATRKGVTGIPISPVPVFWNVEKKSSL
jgi:peptide/nickel transport system substrate-binding protein